MTREELTDLIAEALDDSMGPDWNTRLGARYVVAALAAQVEAPLARDVGGCPDCVNPMCTILHRCERQVSA